MGTLADERLFCNICVLIHLRSRTWLFLLNLVSISYNQNLMGLCANRAKFSVFLIPPNDIARSQMVGWFAIFSCRPTNASPPNGWIYQRTRSYVQRGVNPEKKGKAPVVERTLLERYEMQIVRWYMIISSTQPNRFDQTSCQVDTHMPSFKCLRIFCNIVTFQFSCLFFLSKFFLWINSIIFYPFMILFLPIPNRFEAWFE